MAVPAVPFWISAAKTEFSGNNGWCSDIITHSRRTVPRWMSDLGGASDIIPVTLPSGRHGSINVASYVTFENGKKYSIIVPGDAFYIADSTGVGALICTPGGSISSCSLNISAGAHIWGRGGNGGNGNNSPGGFHGNTINAGGGGSGGPAIVATNNVTINIAGDVRGGGGGGGGGGLNVFEGIHDTSGSGLGGGGGGGQPYGSGGPGGSYPQHSSRSLDHVDGVAGTNASDSGPGYGQSQSGVVYDSWRQADHDSGTERINVTSAPGGNGGVPGAAGGGGGGNRVGGAGGGGAGPQIRRV